MGLRDITIDLAARRDELNSHVEQLETDLEKITGELRQAMREAKAAEVLYQGEQRRWARMQPELIQQGQVNGVHVGQTLREAALHALGSHGPSTLEQIENVLVNGGFRFEHRYPRRQIHAALIGSQGQAHRKDNGIWHVGPKGNDD